MADRAFRGAGFKIGMVALIALACRAIASQRLRTARRILEFGSVAGSTAVIYSVVVALQRG